jgi:1-phosphatidylinositol-4-phosphate 5-kinase
MTVWDLKEFKKYEKLRLRHCVLDRIQVSQAWSSSQLPEKIINIYETVEIYDYAYRAFHKLREEDGITPEVIWESLNPEANLASARAAGEGAGKSGSFFFFSYYRRFIVKTMFESELDAFLQKLEVYFKHLDRNPNSLLVRIYGVF